jgi:hypothetical protein
LSHYLACVVDPGEWDSIYYVSEAPLLGLYLVLVKFLGETLWEISLLLSLSLHRVGPALQVILDIDRVSICRSIVRFSWNIYCLKF